MDVDRIRAAYRQAVEDPQYHRQAFIVDHALPGEKRGRLLPPQEAAVRAIENAVAQAGRSTNATILTVRSARQTMKNDVDATVLTRLLHRYRRKGGTVVRTAPSFSPQLITSRRRIDWLASRDTLFQATGQPEWRYGHMLCHGKAEVHLLSGAQGSNPEGATASLLLSVDEAHRFDRGIFEDRFAPMSAFRNAPTCMYGVAADRGDLLYEHIVGNLREAGYPDPDNPGGRVIDLPTVQQYPAEVWCDLLPTYRAHVDLRERRLGADHPAVLTNYHLTDVDAVASFLSRGQQQALLVGEGQRGQSLGRDHVALIDLAGEVEGAAGTSARSGDIEAGADACAVLVFSVDRAREKFGWPACRLVEVGWWVGLPMEGPGSTQERIEEMLGQYRPQRVVVDARGVGYGTARRLGRTWPGVVDEYMATATTKSEDLYGLLAMLNAGAVSVFRGDGSPEWAQWEREVTGARRKLSGHSLLDLLRPARRPGDPPARVDLLRAASYLPRAVAQADAGHWLESYVARDDPHLAHADPEHLSDAPAWTRDM